MSTKIESQQEPGTPQPGPSTSRKRTTVSMQANLIFPVARVDRLLREGQYAKRYSKKAAIYFASVLECLSSVIIRKAGETTLAAGKKVIQQEHLVEGIQEDTYLNRLLNGRSALHIANTQQ